MQKTQNLKMLTRETFGKLPNDIQARMSIEVREKLSANSMTICGS